MKIKLILIIPLKTEQELLGGKYFSDLLGIDSSPLEQTYMLFAKGYSSSHFNGDIEEIETIQHTSEQDLLEKEKST